ncbi:MAG: hypothetical protein AAFY84_18090, partial [Pseudomonadota bacterium]
KMLKQIVIALCAGSSLYVSAGAMAQSEVSVPHTFTAGTRAIASQVNENFNALADASNSQAASIEELQAQTTAIQEALDSLLAAATQPKEQMVCTNFVSESITWPGAPGATTTNVCVTSSEPSVTFRASLTSIYQDGWRVITVGGSDGSSRAAFVFERPLTTTD